MFEDKDLYTFPLEDNVEEVVVVDETEVKVEDAQVEVTEDVIEDLPEEPVVVKKKKAPKPVEVEEPAEEQPVVVEEEKTFDKVAIYSARPAFWSGVGKVERGYNIVTKEQADKWVTRIHVRMATPEEIQGVLNK